MASISLVLARCTPRRIKHNKRSTYVEEFLVQWDPEDFTLQEAQQQQLQGFVITSITSLDERVSTTLLEIATTTKRPRGRPRVADRPFPPKCRVQFAPSPQGPTHSRIIKGGAAALEAFLAIESAPPQSTPPRQQDQPGFNSTFRHRATQPPFPHERRSSSPPPAYQTATTAVLSRQAVPPHAHGPTSNHHGGRRPG